MFYPLNYGEACGAYSSRCSIISPLFSADLGHDIKVESSRHSAETIADLKRFTG